jgi:dUTPase
MPVGILIKTTSDILMNPGRVYALETGLSFEIPEGYHLKLFTVNPHLRLLQSLTWGNGPLDIDVQNTSIHTEDVSPGDTIALGVLEKSEQFVIELVTLEDR